MCPFFKGQDTVNITCEAPFDGPVLRLSFVTKEEKSRQRSIFCECSYKRCEIYRCIMQNKYPEREE